MPKIREQEHEPVGNQDLVCMRDDTWSLTFKCVSAVAKKPLLMCMYRAHVPTASCKCNLLYHACVFVSRPTHHRNSAGCTKAARASIPGWCKRGSLFVFSEGVAGFTLRSFLPPLISLMNDSCACGWCSGTADRAHVADTEAARVRCSS